MLQRRKINLKYIKFLITFLCVYIQRVRYEASAVLLTQTLEEEKEEKKRA